MSDLSEKLGQPRRSTGGRAQATLEQLTARYGQLRVRGDMAELTSMGKREVWRRVSGSGLKGTWELQQTQ